MPSLDLYKIFFTVARSGSLSKAAEKLYITQPAVSHALKNLEEKLGTKLFVRTPKGVNLTHEGALLIQYVEQAYNFIFLGEQKLAETVKMRSGEVHIVASETLCKHFLLPHLSRFTREFPQIKIHVTNRPTRETVQFILGGKADVGLVFLPVEEPELLTTKVLPIQDCFVVGDKLRHLTKAEMALEKIKEYPLIMLEEGSNTRHYIQTFLTSEGITVSPEIELGSIDLIAEFAKQNFGVATVIKEFAKRDMGSAALFELKTVPAIPPRNIGIIHMKDLPPSKATSAFIDCCLAKPL